MGACLYLPPLIFDRASMISRKRSKFKIIIIGRMISGRMPRIIPVFAHKRCSFSAGAGFARNANHANTIAKIAFSNPSKFTKQQMPSISDAVANAYFCPRIRESFVSISGFFLSIAEKKIVGTYFLSKLR